MCFDLLKEQRLAEIGLVLGEVLGLLSEHTLKVGALMWGEVGLVDRDPTYELKLGVREGYLAVRVVSRAADETGLVGNFVRLHGGDEVRGKAIVFQGVLSEPGRRAA